jgi:tetratricopeptide (TPR) repeat protein
VHPAAAGQLVKNRLFRYSFIDMKSKKILTFVMRAFMCAAVAAVFSGCFSGPVTIANGASVAEIVQMGQVAMDKNRYDQAIQYYQAIKRRYPDDDEAVVGADYEVAFIHYKQKKYSVAKNEFNRLLERYDAPEGEFLPKKYQILSGIVLKKIDEKQKIVADE